MFDGSHLTISNPPPHPHRGNTSRLAASRATVLVALSSPLVSAGLIAILSRLEGCEVRLWNMMSEASSLECDVVVVDDVALAAQFSTTAVAGQPLHLAAPRVVLLTNHPKQIDAASIGCVSAWLSVHCPEEELLDTVQTLLHDALSVRWPTAITKSLRQPAPSDPTGAVSSDRPTGGLAPGAMRRVRQHIEGCFAQKVDLSHLAGIAGLSTSYFSRAFKQSFGMPPHRYVMTRRLAAAAELIRKTSKPLAEVAIDVGFSDQSHFTRIFTQMTGETPGALRRRYR